MTAKAGSWELADATLNQEARKIDPQVSEVAAESDRQIIALRPKEAGGHVPTTLVYRSLFEVEEKTDMVIGFDPSQDKIDIHELFISFGGDMSLDNLKTRVSPTGDLQLIINDGPDGVGGANYHFLTIKAFQQHKHPPTPKTLAKFIIVTK